MKEMTSVAQTVATDEEREELEKEGIIPPSTPAQERPHTRPTTPATESRSSDQAARSLDTSAVALQASVSSEDTSKRTLLPDSPPIKNGSKSVPTSPTQENKDLHTSKKRNRLTPEQRKKLQELEDERKKALEERVKTLTTKLLERLRPFVEAQKPGGNDDPETRTFQDKIRLEAEDLKLESFGVEVRRCWPARYRARLAYRH